MDTTIAKLRGAQRILWSRSFLSQHLTVLGSSALTAFYGGLGFLTPIPGELPGALSGGIMGLVVGSLTNLWLSLRALKDDRIRRALEITPLEFPLKSIAESIYGGPIAKALRTRRDRQLAVAALKSYIHLFGISALDYSNRSVQLRSAADSRRFLLDSLYARGETPSDGVLKALDDYRYWLQDVNHRGSYTMANKYAERSVTELAQALGVKTASSWKDRALSR